MVSIKPTRGSYEESPEALKDLFQNPADNHGSRLSTRESRDALIDIHKANLKLLAEGNVPVKNFVLPSRYPPSRASIRDTSVEKINLQDLSVEKRNTNAILMVRTIIQPYIYSATNTVVEDKNGDAARLTIGNLEDSMLDPLIPAATIVAIKQPCWRRQIDGGYHIRVDHPSDLVILQANDEFVPESWRSDAELDSELEGKDWKKEGDMMFLKKKFRTALQHYDRGLRALDSKSNSAAKIDLYRKKCGVNIVLLRLDDAADDLSQAIVTHALSDSQLAGSPMSDLDTIKSWLHNGSTEDPLQISSSIPRPLKELAARIKFDLGIYQTSAEYNLPLISSYVGPLTLHVDAAHYISDTEVRKTENHGRGLFAKRDFKIGELVSAEKAFVLPGYFIQDRSSDCLIYSLGEGTASPRPGALLFKELVQKLRWNPSLRRDYFELDDGGYWKEYGWEVSEGEEIPVDVFRVEIIRQRNCFSVPTRSVDMISQPPNSNPELRNGCWLHASYVNHSCLPNSVRTFIGDIHFLRATRDITAGEEITHQYVSPDIDIIDRQERYRGTWGFECDCGLCKTDGRIDEASRKERSQKFEDLKNTVMKLGERGMTITSIKKIARGLREIEALYSPSDAATDEGDLYRQLPRLALVHPSLYLTEAWKGVNNVDKTIEYARKLLRNFGILTTTDNDRFEVVSNSGLINIEAVRALRYLAEGYTSKGESQLAKDCIELGKLWFLIITGSEVGMEEFLKF
ncbi:hypothetical protein BU24DRAFT_464383 [Aaosphaeria arxii CBS 175.79]|uniref:SET domain-containing protein n=1 Tax=Aaosphaeria arxii CBS 175.79 TaxID=1450172 RepID=A0A6A5XLJ4_9PLEO|nr:uncharacterized protein BU24DRAFT_464383 [Aaosphaeria arxii CBS 175.79]KAF2013620.1 hypothetical protein BU24DRAFT_464383 [Aaosphaeria arxii CBS 175.79]